MKKWFILVVVLAAGAGGGYLLWHGAPKPKPAAQAQERPSTACVQPRNIKFVFTSAGDIGPADQVSVRPEINGKVAVLPVDIGDQLKKDSLLFALDDTDLQTARSSQITEIEGCKLALEKTRRYDQRNEKLFADHLISQEVFDDGKTDFELAQNSLEKAEKALKVVEVALEKTRIVAPFDCTVLTRPVSNGQAVSGTGGNNAGTEVMTIANLRDMIVMAHVNQADVTRIKPGQVVDIEVEAVPGLKFQGTVDRIAPQATIKNNIKGFDTEILLRDIDPRVRPGMTANLSIPLVSAENVLAVPLASVFTEPDGRYVYVKTDEGFDIRPVQIGVTDYQYAEVVSGLLNGEIVSLVRPDESENPGAKVQKAGHKNGAPAGLAPTNSTATNRLAQTLKTPAS